MPALLSATDATLNQLDHASLWRRAGAFCIDVLILLLPMWSLSLLCGYTMFPDHSPGTEADFPVTASIVNTLIWVAYCTGFTSSALQATPGKRLMRLKVGRPDGSRLSPARAFARVGVLMPLNLPGWLGHASPHWSVLSADLLLTADVLAVAFTRERTAGHDLLCDTRVFSVSSHPVAPRT
ncbi:RDD family protein [Nitrospirillum iridis]|uniref:RDD family protein n=1 Tax=Nitrospirillum iridis TaxID=765888 RepID=UPI0016138AA1